MQGVGEGSRQRCSVVRMVIKGVPANITTTWEPAEMPVLGPHPRPREPDGGAGEQEGRGSASPSSWGSPSASLGFRFTRERFGPVAPFESFHASSSSPSCRGGRSCCLKWGSYNTDGAGDPFPWGTWSVESEKSLGDDKA